MNTDTIQKRIAELQNEYTKQIGVIQNNQQWHLIEEITRKLQQSIDALMRQVEAEAITPEESREERSHYYRHDECDIDLDGIVYDGDRLYFEGFLQNPQIAEVAHAAAGRNCSNSKKELLKHALRLAPGMAPSVFRCIERCKEKLGLKSKIDIYVAQNPMMNAFCYPPHEGCIYILVTSALLEKLNEDELTFVIGHEIGHYLYKHNLLSPNLIHEKLGAYLSPAESIKLFSWSRNAELSADRIGLICCGSYHSACMANFKISSGIASDVLSFSIDAYLHQYEDFEKELASGTSSMEDFYSSHPINPMRVVALDIFSKSVTFVEKFNTGSVAELSEKEMERKIDGFMKLMEPQYLNFDDEASKNIKEFIFLGCLTIASTDGEITQEEMDMLSQILPDQNNQELFYRVKDWTLEMKMVALSEQAEKILPHTSLVNSCNIIRDLVLVSLSDGEFEQCELECLIQICGFFRIHPSFIDQVLNSIAYQQAA
jgi:tellurite resistance protein